MEERKLCQCCQKNHPARSYVGEDGKQELYCLECYARLFLDGGQGAENALNVCPYCGTTLAEVKASKIVGCAHCYFSMQAGLFSMVQKMQGGRAHCGKIPFLEGEYGDPYDFEDTVGAEYRAKAMEQARYDRQCNELNIIIEKLREAGDFEGAKSYEEKLTAMKNRSTVEEDFVWRRSLSKQS